MAIESSWVDAAVEAMREPEVFFVCNLYGSAGSFFFHTLLDSHPDLYTFIFDLRRAPVFVDDFDRHTRAEHISALVDGNDRFFDTGAAATRTGTLDKLGEDRTQRIVIDRKLFSDYLLAILDRVEFNIRNLSLALTIAHNYARGIRLRTNRFAFYAHDLPRTVQFIRQFGCGRLVALSRHPINAYASRCSRLFRYNQLLAKKPDVPARIALGVALYRPTQILYLEEMYRLLGAGVRDIAVVPVEELHANPSSTMQAVARHMGLAFGPSLLQSTVGGLKWWGSHFTRVHGFDPTLHRDLQVSRIGRADAAAVFGMTARLSACLGYGDPPVPLRWRLAARAPGKRYPRDIAALLATLRQREPDARRRVNATLIAAERVAKYVVGRSTFENRAIRSMTRLDETTRLDALNLLTRVAPLASSW